MSFLVAVHVNEGIVLASDRRSTYSRTIKTGDRVVEQFGIHTTASTDKTFLCPNGAGISTCGDAALLGKPITGFIQDMIRTRIGSACPVPEMPQRMTAYFQALPQIPDTNFIVAGYDQGRQLIYKLNVRSGEVEQVDTDSQGATWDGETLTLTRLLMPVGVKSNGSYVDLPTEEILWGYFTLQDAVDFARYAVETTIQTMRFKNVVETVGGKVDILVITPDGSKWLQKEELR